MNSELAVIIPAYKSRFLARTLDSVAAQTTKGFKTYVFDDNSPNRIDTIVHAALSKNDSLSYDRFEDNLGGIQLTRHYDRCVKKTKEPWIWLFSDDDLMDEDCVSSFWDTVHETKFQYHVYCFDSTEIDAEDRITALHPVLPDLEGWKQYAYFLFRGNRVVPQQAMIFSRAAYEKLGGFVEFPLAWTSDQATLMALAGDRGIKRMSGGSVRFRKSGQNISSTVDAAMSLQKLDAAKQFMQWVMRRLDEVPDQGFPMSDESLRQLAFKWFKRHLVDLHLWYGPTQCFDTARFVSDTWREPFGKALARMLWVDLGMIAYGGRGLVSGWRRRGEDCQTRMESEPSVNSEPLVNSSQAVEPK